MADGKNRVALVTGGGRGIGRSIVEHLADDGFDVVVHYGQKEEAARSVADSIRKQGRRAWTVGGDLADLTAIDGLVARIEDEVGKIDVLVNNAGLLLVAPLSEMAPNDFDQLFNVNVRGLFFLTQRLLPSLNDGGRIINLSSIVSTMASMPGISAYSATKAAVDCFTRTWALELGPRRITVNAVGPGLTETDMSIGLTSDPKLREDFENRTPLGRLGQPADIAKVVAFLASEAGGWINGQHLNASGGYHIAG